jgi:hypothetical protein
VSSQADNAASDNGMFRARLGFAAGLAEIPTVDRSAVSNLLAMEDDRAGIIDHAPLCCQASSTRWNLCMGERSGASDAFRDDAYRNLDGPLRNKLQAVRRRKRLWVKLASAEIDRGQTCICGNRQGLQASQTARQIFRAHRCKMARALHMNNVRWREGGENNLPGGALMLPRDDDCL